MSINTSVRLRMGMRWVVGMMAVVLSVGGWGCASSHHGESGGDSGGRAEGWKRYTFTAPHMGTMWTIQVYGGEDEASLVEAAAQKAFARVQALEAIMTDYDPESELLRLCRNGVGQSVPVSEDLYDILRVSGEIVRESKGVFDPTVGPLVQVWRRARRQREMPEMGRIEEAKSVFGWSQVVMSAKGRRVGLRKAGMRLDLGGIAKGYAADAALKVLEGEGCGRAMVAASGDFAIGAAPPGKRGWRIQVGDPEGTNQVMSPILVLAHAGVSTSGDVEQFVELGGRRFSHIVDPRTGMGLTNRIQATVIAENATRSDALATAVCILGMDEGVKMVEGDRRLGAMLVVKQGEQRRVLVTKRFPKP